MTLLLVAFLLLLGGLEKSDASVTTECLYKSTKSQTIVPKHRGNSTNTCSILSCITTHCKALKHCALSFNKETGECMSVSPKVLDKVPTLVKNNALFKKSKDAAWMTIISAGLEIKSSAGPKTSGGGSSFGKFKPEIFWSLDNKVKGRNQGLLRTAGNVTGAENMTYDKIGPKKISPQLNFTHLSQRLAYSLESVPLKENLNLTSAFTFAAWIKADTSPTGFKGTILTGIVNKHSELKWFLNVKGNKMQIALSLGQNRSCFHTGFFNYAKPQWQHVAVVYDGVGKAQIYVNGKAVTITTRKKAGETPQPQCLRIGDSFAKGGKIKDKMSGSLGCLYIFKKALKASDIKLLQSICPAK